MKQGWFGLMAIMGLSCALGYAQTDVRPYPIKWSRLGLSKVDRCRLDTTGFCTAQYTCASWQGLLPMTQKVH